MSNANATTRCPALLFWDFHNVVSVGGVSTAVGIPSDPTLVSGFISQTGGGPAENFGPDVGPVFLTRYLGTYEVFMWFTLTREIFVSEVTMRHWHNHNPGFPTHPNYRVVLQLDRGNGFKSCGSPLHLKGDNSGGFDWLSVGCTLPPGSYRLRWHPQALKNGARDTGSEFFAFKDVTLHGQSFRHSDPPPPACPLPTAPAPAPVAKPAVGDHITVEIGGVTVERLKVMESKYPGVCVRSGQAFAAGAVIGFKHRSSLTDEQRLAIFGTGRPSHLTVALTPEEGGGAAPTPEVEDAYDGDVE
ncbi:MAG: hypothetical protein K2V38_25850 [Gemmataceae bacterium]|nr:hypothetical protein [Gemmataceae bacterium]